VAVRHPVTVCAYLPRGILYLRNTSAASPVMRGQQYSRAGRPDVPRYTEVAPYFFGRTTAATHPWADLMTVRVRRAPAYDPPAFAVAATFPPTPAVPHVDGSKQSPSFRSRCTAQPHLVYIDSYDDTSRPAPPVYPPNFNGVFYQLRRSDPMRTLESTEIWPDYSPR